MSRVTVAAAVAEDLGGLGGIDDNMLNSRTNDMIAFDDVTSTTMDDSMMNDMIAVDAVTSTTTTTITTTTMDENTNYERSLSSDFKCLFSSTAQECENTECCTWGSLETISGIPNNGLCSDSKDDGCPIYFCGIYHAESDCENAESCCTWSSSLSMCSGNYSDSCSPFLDDVSPTDDNKVNDFAASPTYDEMTLTPTSDWRPSSYNDGDDDDDDDDDDTRNKIILGLVIGGVCVIIILGVLCWVQKCQPQKTNKKKKRGNLHTPSEQFLNTTAYGGLDFTHTTSNGPTPTPTTRFDFEAGVAARADAVASFNNHTSMTHEPTTTTTTTPDATVTKDNNHLKEGKVKGTTTAAAATKGIATTGTAAVAATAVVMAEAVPSSSLPSSSATATNVHGTETVVAVAVAVAVPVTKITN